MYIILSVRSNKILRSWTHLQPSPDHTEFVGAVRDQMAPTYPEDQLIVMHTATLSVQRQAPVAVADKRAPEGASS